MVQPRAVSNSGMVGSQLLEQVMELTKIAIGWNECCKVLHALLKELQPTVDHAVRQVSQSNFDNPFKRPRSAVHDWLDELEGTLKRAAAAVEVSKCIKQQPDFNPWSRYNTGKRILDVTESVKKLLQQAGLVGLVVTFSESSRAEKMEKMMLEIYQMIYDLGATAQRIEFATVTQEALQENCTTSSAQRITSEIKSALHNLLQNLSLPPSDNMSRVDTGASSSSSCSRELIVNEDAHRLADIQQVPQPVFGLDNFTMRLQRSITSSSIDAEPRRVGVWGMGGAGKTLLAQIAYNSTEVREHFEGGELIWLTVSQSPNIKGLYDSFCRQLGLRPMSFAQLEEYKTRLHNEFLRRRVFLVLDDVWNKGVLEQLDLAKGLGSVTLVTTRNRPVLEKAGVRDEDEVKVGVLSKEDSWKLFCVHAFPRGLSNISSDEQGVAELVAKECKGLPLALKVIGGSMVGKTTRPEWEFQLNCLQKSRKLPEQQEEEALFGRLKLSYDNLDNDSPVCKECFLGFAAFPEDDEVKMEELIKLWKAQGLLGDRTKMFGDDPTLPAYYLVGLMIGRSMIELTEDGYKLSYSYKVHDVMRDLALHIIEGQSPRTCLYRPGKELEEFPGDWIRTYERQPCEVRNLSLMSNDLTTLNGVTFSAPKLEVLLLSKNLRLRAMPKQFLKGIENLKVLDLSHCHMLISLPREIGNLRELTHLYLVGCQQLQSLPREIGDLRQLTHLDLAYVLELKSLPKEIGKLAQLTYLDLQGTNLQSLPKEVGQLTQLIHLDLSDCEKLKKLPKSMGYLRSLQYLSLVGASSDSLWGKSSSKIYGQADICELTTLTTLHISGKTCKKLELSKLVKLKSFHIHDFHKLETLPEAIHSMVHLEEFWVFKCEQLKILPSFITLFSKLKVLRLDGMSSLDSLPALNTLKLLSTLCIMMCKSIKKLPDSFTSSDAFPSLKELNCYGSGLVEFLEVEDGAMPKLQILNLDSTNIKSLPDTLIYLKNLKVVYVCKDRFDDLCQKFENSWLLGKFERQPCELHKLSLMENDLTTRNGVTFSAPKLDFLLLAQNEKLEAMPKQFLKGIENLKVLEPSTSQGKSRENEIHQFSQHGEALVTVDQVGHFEINENCNFEEENLQKSLQHMLIGLQRHGEAAATNLHQFHAECMGDFIFVAAREVVQGVEFLFSDAQCMSRVVGVGLERAKVLVTWGYEVGVTQLSEIDWKISWEKLFSQVKDSESSELVAIKMPKLQGDHVKSVSLPAEDISRKFGVSLKDFPETHVITLNCKEEQSGQFFPLVWKVVDEYRNLKCGSTCATTKQTSGTGSTKSPNTSSSGAIQQSTSGGGPNFSQSPSLTRQEEKMDDDEDDDKSQPPEGPPPPGPPSAPNDMRNRRLKVSIFPGAGGAFHDPDTKQPVQQTPFQQPATIMPVIEIEFLQEGIAKKFIIVTTKTQCNLGTDSGGEQRGVNLYSWFQNNIEISFKGKDQHTQLLSSSASAQDDSLIETKSTINKALMASTSYAQEESRGAGGQIRLAGSGVQGQIDIKATETQGGNLTSSYTQESGGIKQIQGFIVRPQSRNNDLVFKFCLPDRLMPGSSTQSGMDLKSLLRCDDTFEPKVTGTWNVWSKNQHAFYIFEVRRYLYRSLSSELHQDEKLCLMQDYQLLMFVNLAMTHLDRYNTNDIVRLTEQDPELPYVIKVTPGG